MRNVVEKRYTSYEEGDVIEVEDLISEGYNPFKKAQFNNTLLFDKGRNKKRCSIYFTPSMFLAIMSFSISFAPSYISVIFASL